MKRKKRLIVCAIVLTIILAVGIVYLLFADDSQLLQSESSVETQTSSVPVTSELQEEKFAVEESVVEESETQESESEKNESVEEEQVSEGGNEESGNGASGVNVASNVVLPKDTEIEESSNIVDLPYKIPGSDLIIQKFDTYSGVYIEDGSDEDVSDITVVELSNEGKTNIEYVKFSVLRNDKTLEFEASAIPSGATVVVQEKNRVAWENGTYKNCNADIAEIDAFESSEDKIKIEEVGDQTLKVTNLTDNKLPAVRIFYKFYMDDENAYVGGITYNAKVTDLEGGQSVEITPSHYTKGMSKIMMVRTYTTAE